MFGLNGRTQIRSRSLMDSSTISARGAFPFEPAKLPRESFPFAMEEGNSGARENCLPRGASEVHWQSSFSLIGVISSIDSYCRHYFCGTSGCLAQCRGLCTVDPLQVRTHQGLSKVRSDVRSGNVEQFRVGSYAVACISCHSTYARVTPTDKMGR
jgi:hypothetical protein